jgi:hypothetical protein
MLACDEAQWKAQFARNQTQFVDAACRAKQEIAQGLAKLMDPIEF